MKQFIVDRHTTPGTPAMDPVDTPKVPVYDTMTDAEADLANLNVGQMVATKDTGADMAQPVDVVEDGNEHAVTSNAVADALSYSTTEQLTGGKWIDGKPIYRKVVDFGNLPNATEKAVAHNISNIDKYTHIYGVALNSSNENTYPLPFGYPSSNNSIGLIANLTNVRINTGANLSPLYAYVTLEYTKTTDN